MRAYNNLSQAELSFGSIKGPYLQILPIHHHLYYLVLAHLLICMLAYYLTWHLKAAWKPLLFTHSTCPSLLIPSRNLSAPPPLLHKAQTKLTSILLFSHSYRTLLT